MRLTGRRESNNVEDRRRMSGKAKAGIGGIGGIIVIALFTLLSGGNLGDIVGNVMQSGALNQVSETETQQGQRKFTDEEQELAKFSSQILAGTEDVWTKVFQKMDMNTQHLHLCFSLTAYKARVAVLRQK